MRKIKQIVIMLMTTLCLVYTGGSLVHAAEVEEAPVEEAPVEEETPIEDDDEPTNTNNHDEDDDEPLFKANHDDDKPTANQNEDEDGAPKTTTADTNKKATMYVANADEDDLKATAQSENTKISKQSTLPKTKPVIAYTVSDYNDDWVPYWYWWTIINNHSESSMPKKHDANVKTNHRNVKAYKAYMQKQRKLHRQLKFWLTVVGIVVVIICAFLFT